MHAIVTETVAGFVQCDAIHILPFVKKLSRERIAQRPQLEGHAAHGEVRCGIASAPILDARVRRRVACSNSFGLASSACDAIERASLLRGLSPRGVALTEERRVDRLGDPRSDP